MTAIIYLVPELSGTTGKECLGILLIKGQIWYLPGQVRIIYDPFFQETSWENLNVQLSVITVHLSLQISPNKQPRKLQWRSFLMRYCNSRSTARKTSQRWDKRPKRKREMKLRLEAVLQELALWWEKGEQKRKSQQEEMGIRTTRLFIFGLELKQGHCPLLPFLACFD